MHTAYVTVWGTKGSATQRETPVSVWTPALKAGEEVWNRFTRQRCDTLAEALDPKTRFEQTAEEKRATITLKRDDCCRDCGRDLKAGYKARWIKGYGTYCASQRRCDEVRRFTERKMSAEERANAYLDGNEAALGGGPEGA